MKAGIMKGRMCWGRFLWEMLGGRWEGSIKRGRWKARIRNHMGIGNFIQGQGDLNELDEILYVDADNFRLFSNSWN